MNFFQKVVAKRIEAEKAVIKASKGAKNAAEGYWKKLGPGLTTGAADDDPSGIATYSQAGARFGFNMAWLAVLTYPFMAVVQEMCARIGLVTGRGLAANIRLHYPRTLLYILAILLFAANAFNIGANLGAMASATKLVFPGASIVWLVIGFTVFSLLLQIFTSYKTYANYLKWLALILFAYVLTAFSINLNWGEVWTHVVFPQMSFDKDTILMIAAILGTTISPYLFFWQTSQEVEEKILHGQEGEDDAEAVIAKVPKRDMKDMRTDVWSGMFISNLVMFFIIIVCGATLFAHGITNIETAAQAAEALKPLAGAGAYLLFAIGIIGTGLLAVPILAGSTSYAVAESFKWKSGLHHRLREAYAFYAVIIVSMIVGLALNFVGLDPIKALIYSAIINCIVAPIVLVFIVALSSNKEVMGEHANSRLTKYMGMIVTTIMFVVAIVTCKILLL